MWLAYFFLCTAIQIILWTEILKWKYDDLEIPPTTWHFSTQAIKRKDGPIMTFPLPILHLYTFT